MTENESMSLEDALRMIAEEEGQPDMPLEIVTPEVELKPCPFCGIEDPEVADGSVLCKFCGAYTACIDQWNKRPIEDALREDLDLAKSALIALREWLWSGKLDPKQKPGAPIIAPPDVVKIANGALDRLDPEPPAE